MLNVRYLEFKIVVNNEINILNRKDILIKVYINIDLRVERFIL